MDFKDTIQQLAERISKQKEYIKTEEATKTAFIMPLISALGYDVFNPLEVVPEYTCDIGIKKGEKIDYAVMKDGDPILLVECKHCEQNLEKHDSQLLRYFGTSKARFAILTNGIQYKFYTDLEKSNVMDSKPFFDIDITNLKSDQIDELKKFHKSYFNEDIILSTAAELQTSLSIKEILLRDFSSPSDEFVRYFVKSINDGKYSAKLVELYTPLVKKAINSYVNDVISERLNTVMEIEGGARIDMQDSAITESLPEGVVFMSDDKKIITTSEEIEAYNIVKGILRKNIEASRITYQDYQSYFSITIDGSYKWICRIYIQKRTKVISFPSESNREDRFELQSVDDIFNYSEKLEESLGRLIK